MSLAFLLAKVSTQAHVLWEVQHISLQALYSPTPGNIRTPKKTVFKAPRTFPNSHCNSAEKVTFPQSLKAPGFPTSREQCWCSRENIEWVHYPWLSVQTRAIILYLLFFVTTRLMSTSSSFNWQHSCRFNQQNSWEVLFYYKLGDCYKICKLLYVLTWTFFI